MESSSQALRVHCSEAAARLVRAQDPAIVLRDRGEIEVVVVVSVCGRGGWIEEAASQRVRVGMQGGHWSRAEH